MSLSEEHKVVKDIGGMAQVHRLTCKTCSDATIVKYHWMTNDRWQEEKAKFMLKHPCSKVVDLDQKN